MAVTVASISKPRVHGGIASFVFLAVILAVSADSQTTNTPGYLLTGLKIGSLSSKVGITGTLINPPQFKLRFEAISALLSLFELQEKINRQMIELTASEGSESAVVSDADEDNTALTDMQILLENVIQDSCKYINWTLSDFFYPGYNCEVLTQQSFNCSREAAELLQLNLDLWMANNNAYSDLKDYVNSCDEGTSCSVETVGRSRWVTELNLNVSDPEEVQVKRYLDCII